MFSVLVLSLAASFGSAGTFTVSDTADPGSLRNSVASANGSSGSTVIWSTGTGGTINLGSPALSINGNTTLDVGPAASAVTIAGSTITLTSGLVTFSNSNAAQPWTISSVVAGAGELSKTGAGTLILTGTNTYTGGTAIGAGVLNVNSDSALGNASGGIVFGGGTLQTAASITSARTIILVGNGTFDTNGFNSTFSGTISGVGGLVKQGAGTLFLTGANSYSGGTSLEGGILNINNDAALGSGGITLEGGTLQTGASIMDGRTIVIVGSGTLDNGGNASNFGGLISGSGSLVVSGTGTMTLSGANTYTGGTTLTSGVTLVATNDLNLGDAGGSITLDSGTLQTQAGISNSRIIHLGAGGGTIDNFGMSDVFSGAIDGTGGLTFVGAGTVTLSGANSYLGGTTVSAGKLAYGADDVLPSGGDLAIAAGGTVDLSGFSQNTSTIGVVTNNGLLNLRSGSMNAAGYTGSGTLGLTLASGFTNLTATSVSVGTGSVLSVNLANPLSTPGSTFTPIAWSAQSGTFTIVSPALLSFTPTYGANGLTLLLGLVPFSSVASSPNQKAVGATLEPFRAAPTGDMGVVLSNLYTLSGPQVRSALDQIGPISLAAVGSLGLAASGMQTAALDRRMSGLASWSDSGLDAYSIQQKSFAPGTLLAEDGVEDTAARLLESKGSSDERSGLFVSVLGTQGKLKDIAGASGTQPGYNFYSGGFLSGIDHRFGPNLAMGLSLGYQYGNASIDAPASGSVIGNSARYGLYTTVFDEATRLNLYVGGAQDFFSTSRDISFGGLGRTATAKPKGSELNWNARLESDYRTRTLGTLTPFAEVNSDRLNVKSFTESGAGALDLSVAEQTAESLRSVLGLRESLKFRDEFYTCLGYVSAAWQHEYKSQSRPIDAQLASGAGSAFSVTTVDMPRDGALLGAGFSVKMSAQSVANLDYVYDVRSGYQENRLSGTLRYRY
jgi:autotransporter-associated beta strand protein